MKVLFGSIAVCILIGSISYSISKTKKPNTVLEIYLSDGTRCVVMDTYSKGAISCDWQTAKENK